MGSVDHATDIERADRRISPVRSVWRLEGPLLGGRDVTFRDLDSALIGFAESVGQFPVRSAPHDIGQMFGLRDLALQVDMREEFIGGPSPLARVRGGNDEVIEVIGLGLTVPLAD